MTQGSDFTRPISISSAAQARALACAWLDTQQLPANGTGLPEFDDRYRVWRVPVLTADGQRAGEVVLVQSSGTVDTARSSAPAALRQRFAALRASAPVASTGRRRPGYAKQPTLRAVWHGDSATTLGRLEEGAADLVFTSPPYFDARPEYAEYTSYDEYLAQVQAVIRGCHRVLGEGRFFVMNVSPVLVRRENRNTASRRIPVHFDMHPLFIAEGFEFVDDIIWEKPAGAGWATGRGRRFAADRQPLQYKPVPVTEHLLVYRRKTDRLLDWNINTYPDRAAMDRSRVAGEYEQTDIWRLSPAHDKRHPAVFPSTLAERVIHYYSVETDTVLDPYGGLGTTGRVANALNRGFVMIERDAKFVGHMRDDIYAGKWGPISNVMYACRQDGCACPALRPAA